MALNGKRKQISYDIDFDGALLSSTRACLVIEFIKYLLYERQQIPLPLDQLTSLVNKKSEVAAKSLSHCSTIATNNSLSQNQFGLSLQLPKPVKKNTIDVEFKPNCHIFKSILSDATEKTGVADMDNYNPTVMKSSTLQKSKTLIQDLTQTFDNLKKAFEVCPEIEQVAVLLGGTIASPKESFLLTFPPPCPDADSLPLVACKTTLFKQIMNEDIFGVLTNTLSPTSMMLLLSAPRSLPIQWFLPKMSFSSPKIGTIVSLNFQCSYMVPVCHDLTWIEAEIELSGIEIQDCSLCEKDVSDTDLRYTTPSCETVLLSKQYNLMESNKRDVISEPDNGQLTPSVSRFCIHHRLKYIYSHHKKESTENQNSEIDAVTAHEISPATSDPGKNFDEEKDLIWYQSPLVIKGFIIQ